MKFRGEKVYSLFGVVDKDAWVGNKFMSLPKATKINIVII